MAPPIPTPMLSTDALTLMTSTIQLQPRNTQITAVFLIYQTHSLHFVTFCHNTGRQYLAVMIEGDRMYTTAYLTITADRSSRDDSMSL